MVTMLMNDEINNIKGFWSTGSQQYVDIKFCAYYTSVNIAFRGSKLYRKRYTNSGDVANLFYCSPFIRMFLFGKESFRRRKTLLIYF